MYTPYTVGGTVGFKFQVNNDIVDKFEDDREKEGDEPVEY